MRHHLLTRAVYDPTQWDMQAITRRLQIFEATAVASVAAQTMKPDLWVIAVHPDDPALWDRLEVAKSAGVDIIKLYVTNTGASRDQAAIAAYSAPWRQGLGPGDSALTTRLDDDDAITADFTGRLRALAEMSDPYTAVVYMFPIGIRIHAGRFTEVRHNSNAMATLYTPRGDLRHIYAHRHRDVRDEYPVVDVDLKPAWLWLRHDDTLSGWKAGMSPIRPHIRHLFPHVGWDVIGTNPTGQPIGGGRVFA